jgi:hypothetical protein
MFRIVKIGDHEIIQPYDPCPECGSDMQSVVFVGMVCWNCYEKDSKTKNSEETSGKCGSSH